MDERFNVTYYEKDGKFYKVSWIVPMLSNDTYEIEFNVIVKSTTKRKGKVITEIRKA